MVGDGKAPCVGASGSTASPSPQCTTPPSSPASPHSSAPEIHASPVKCCYSNKWNAHTLYAILILAMIVIQWLIHNNKSNDLNWPVPESVWLFTHPPFMPAFLNNLILHLNVKWTPPSNLKILQHKSIYGLGPLSKQVLPPSLHLNSHCETYCPTFQQLNLTRGYSLASLSTTPPFPSLYNMSLFVVNASHLSESGLGLFIDILHVRLAAHPL